VQAVQGADWQLLVALWAAYNRYLAHVIAQLPDSKLETVCRIGSGKAVTLGFLATDYLTHLIHHLSQLGATGLKLAQSLHVQFPSQASSTTSRVCSLESRVLCLRSDEDGDVRIGVLP
jgi:hypothetical protein